MNTHTFHIQAVTIKEVIETRHTNTKLVRRTGSLRKDREQLIVLPVVSLKQKLVVFTCLSELRADPKLWRLDVVLA
jgi:hypothetical protein